MPRLNSTARGGGDSGLERTVPRTASEEVELYLRTYYSLLRSTAVVQIRTLEEAHAGMKSLMHLGARDQKPDMAAFIYSLLRLPAVMPDVRLVVMGQSVQVFRREGYQVEANWQPVTAPARRRRGFFDGQSVLAMTIASRSDIDDLVPILTSYQIEWNKLHMLLRQAPVAQRLDRLIQEPAARQQVASALDIGIEDLDRLQSVWGHQFVSNLQKIASEPCALGIRLLSGSLSEYRRATQAWWENIERQCPELCSRPVYFVSSNTHSMMNLLTGFALHKSGELLHYLEHTGDSELLQEWQAIQKEAVPSSRENFLYYLLKKYQQTPQGRALIQEQQSYEQSLGMVRVPSEQYFDVEAQIVDLRRLDLERADGRLLLAESPDCAARLKQSDALLLNIDYPLGLAAYDILSVVAENVGSVQGVYVVGKAATLNGVIGDVMISSVVHDEQSQNTYLFGNCFSAADITPYLTYGSVLDNQKAVSVQGTFLQNAHYMEVFYREGYTDIEMEAGPYLSAVYEMHRPKRHPMNEIVNLYGVPFDLGMLHYASDTPLGKGKNLGAGSLSYYGLDSTYAVSIAVLRRIVCLERDRQAQQHREKSPFPSQE